MKHWIVTGISLVAVVLTVVTTIWAQDPPPREAPSTRSAVEASRRQLWRSRIETVQDNGDSSGLQEAIELLQKSMHLPKSPLPPYQPEKNPRETTTQPATTTQPRNPTTRPATTQPSLITSAIRDRIRKLDSIADPAALADALFQAGHPDLAAVFYDRAIKGQTTPKKDAWLLYQAANCRRKTDPQAALKTYDTLVAAHPDSLWGSIALVQKGLVKWQNTDGLTTILKEIEQQGQQSPGSPGRN
jgi:tetratricopeptide (TPR) repeat protein